MCLDLVWPSVFKGLLFVRFQLFSLHPLGENADKLLQFKRWFWSIVEKMSMTERQDLVGLRFFYSKFTLKPLSLVIYGLVSNSH